ncbi:MAG: thioredoxin [Gammaproteobacteria bacterium]|nr:thioredoxin [Gammaproteobacteria bacterium]
MGDGLIFNVDLEDFEQRVIKSSHTTPVLVDFWADWCAPCHAVAPHLAKVIGDFAGRVRLAKVEVDEGENMKLAGRYQVRGFPTVMLLRDGDELARFSGARPAHWIEQWLDEHLAG